MSKRAATYSSAVAAAAARSNPSKRTRRAPPQTRLPFQTSMQRRITAPMARPQTSLQEVKSFDCQILGGALPQVATPPAGAEPGAVFAGITEVNCVPQGATVANRIGNKIVIRSIHLKGSIYNSVLANLAVARLAIIYDKQPNGAFPAFTDIFMEQPLGAAAFYGSLNIANKSRFMVLRDAFYNLDAAQSQIHTFNLYCKGRWETEFGANAGTIGDFRTGAIYLVGVYSSTVVVLSQCSARVRYYD